MPAGDTWGDMNAPVCRKCGHEYFRGKENLCYPCWEAVHEYEVRDPGGVLDLIPMTVIDAIKRPARGPGLFPGK